MHSVLALLLLSMCTGAIAASAASSKQVSGSSVGTVRIGMLAVAVSRVAKVISDQVEPDSEGGTHRVIHFSVNGAKAMAEIQDNKVWRIQILSPGVSTDRGIEVGTPLKTLLRLPSLEGDLAEGALFVWSKSLCGRSFQLSFEPKTDADYLGTWNATTLSSLPANVKVQAILVVGCAK